MPVSPQSKELKFDPHALAHEELLHVYRDRHNALMVTMLSGAIAASVMAWGLTLKTAALGWYVWLLLAYLWHWLMGRPEHPSYGNIGQHVAAAGLAGAGWGGAAAALPWLHLHEQAAIMMLMVMAVNTALPRLVVFPLVLYAFIGGVFLPLALTLPFLDLPTRKLVGMVLLVAVGSLWLSVGHMRALLVRILRKQIAFQHVSSEDRLTGLGNRRRFDENLDAAWSQASRMGVPLSLIILDVDHFKKFNDSYGHPAGDECLRRVAQVLSSCIKRGGDTVARYGGEEFAAVLFHTPMTDAKHIAEKMCRVVMEIGLKHEQSPYGVVTISLGGATVLPSVKSTPQELIQHADAALYRAKELGRNRVEWNMAA